MAKFGPKYWDRHPLVGYLERRYTGDGVANRVQLLGAAYDYAEVVEIGNYGEATQHLISGRTWGDNDRTVEWASGATSQSQAAGTNASCVTRWYGFRNGKTEVQLGTNGAAVGGANVLGRSYLLRAWKFQRIQS